MLRRAVLPCAAPPFISNSKLFQPPQKLDKLEREELQKEAAKFVDAGFRLVATEKVGAPPPAS